jgi:type III pantothenate kinase
MALLLIDIGNSAVKWAETRAEARAETGAVAEAGPLRARVEVHRGRIGGLRDRLLLAWQAAAVDAVVACNVAAPAVVAEIEAAARARKLPVKWLHSEPRYCGSFTLENVYRDPRQLGTDRWHALIGAGALQGNDTRAPLIVVTAGTATTVDCLETIAGGWRFIGGVIAPGVRLMLESLAQGTADLPHSLGTATAFPVNTDDAIASGVLDAQAGLVQRVAHRFAARLGAQPRVLLGGGHADTLAPLLRDAGIDLTIEDNLVLRGLLARV